MSDITELKANIWLIKLDIDELRHRLDMQDMIGNTPRELDSLRLQVASLSEGLRDLEERVKKIEESSFVYKWIMLQVLSIIVLVTVFWLVWTISN